MNLEKLSIPDILLISPKQFLDSRGVFFEFYNKKKFSNSFGLNYNFVQDNISFSQKKGVLRGLHYQLPPMTQAKLVRVIKGEVFDVVVDLRKSSKFFGKFVTQILNDRNNNQLLIPEGFAHGFLTLAEEVIVIYKSSNNYSPDLQRTIKYDDKELNIPWPKSKEIICSDKDLQGLSFKEAKKFN